MKSHLRIRLFMATALLGLFGAASLQAQQPSGQWDFNAGNLTATVGQPLTYIDGPGGATDLGDAFGTTTALGIPDIGGAPAQVMKFPASTNSSLGYNMPTPSSANGGGSLVNDWTIIMDLLFTGTSDRKTRGLMDVDGGLISVDAEFFIDANNQLGIGSFFGNVNSNTWHRIGIVVQASTNRMYFYIDGVRVGSRDAGGAQALDGRWALTVSSIAALFNDDEGGAASGYVNSIQLRDVALNQGQMGALGGPQAAGIPQTIPPVRAYLEQFYPVGGFARPNDKVGFVVNRGDSSISSVVFQLNGQTVTPSITTNGPSITYELSNLNFPRQSDQTAVLSFTDSIAGARSFTNQFRVPILYEDFDLLTLGPSVDPGLGGESNTGTNVWTTNAPPGWVVDNSLMPPQVDPPQGRPEWEGWTFADVIWWSTMVDTQLREAFTKARGAAAIADPDEWDDFGNPDGVRGYFHSFLSTPAISLQGVAPNTAFLKFDSSWRPEGFDDSSPPDGTGPQTNNQTGTIKVSYNGGAAVQLLKWDSQSGSATFHGDNVNETVSLPLNNPAGATNVVLTFGMTDAGNDWWWAVDGIVVDSSATPPPIISDQPDRTEVAEGQPVSLLVVSSGAGLNYQWFKGHGSGKTAITGATSPGYALAPAKIEDNGYYSVVVTNTGGTASSDTVKLTVTPVLGNRLTLLGEDFNGLALGPNVDEGINTPPITGPTNNVWTKSPPTGWAIDDTGVPGAGDPDQDGVTEWAGWSFANKAWWAAAGGQNRDQFTKATGAAAIADSDEWDDITHAGGNMATYLKTRAISLQGVQPNSVILWFDSSWNPESPQKANIAVTFDGGAPLEVFRYESELTSPNFHPAELNETIAMRINNPGTATNMVITFGYFETRNNWWYAIDNILVLGDGASVNLGILNVALAGSNLNFTWTGGATVRLQKATTLSPPNWADVAGTTGNSSATEAIGTGNAFYRLFRP